MLGKIIRSLYYILFFVTPLIVIPSTSELFELNKMIVIYSIALLVFCFGAIDILLHKKKAFTRTPFDIPIAVFLAVLVLSWVFSIDRHTSFFGYYGRFNGGIFSMVAFIILYYGVAWYFRAFDIYKLLRLSVVTSFLVMIWGLSGKIGYDFSCLLFTRQLNNSCWTDQFRPAERMFSTLGQPNWMGAYLAAFFFIGLYLYIVQNKKNVSQWYANIPYGIYLVFNFICLLFTRSRSALVAWCVGVVIFAAYFLLKKNKEALKPFASVAAICLLAVLIFKTGIPKVDTFINLPNIPHKTQAPAVVAQSQPALPSEVTESFDIRKIVWKGAWELGKKYPVLGTGPETFAYSYYFVRPQEHNLTSEWDYIYNKAHNEYLNYLATTGFTGLAAYLFLIGSVVAFLIKNIHKPDGVKKEGVDDPPYFYLCILCAYITVLVTNFFGFSTSTSQLVFFVMPALAAAAHAHNTATVQGRRELGFWNYAELAAVGIFGVFSILWLVFFFAADLSYSQGVARMSQGEYQASAADFSDALKLHYEHIYEDRLSTSLASVALLAAYSDSPEQSKKLIALSRYYSDRAIQGSPKNVLYWKTKGKNEYTFFQAEPDKKYLDEAIKDLSQAYKLAPTDPKMPYTLGLLYGAMNKKEESMRYIDKTIALKPDYQDAYILKLKLLRAWKETEQATQLEEEILKQFPSLSKQGLEEEAK